MRWWWYCRCGRLCPCLLKKERVSFQTKQNMRSVKRNMRHERQMVKPREQKQKWKDDKRRRENRETNQKRKRSRERQSMRSKDVKKNGKIKHKGQTKSNEKREQNSSWKGQIETERTQRQLTWVWASIPGHAFQAAQWAHHSFHRPWVSAHAVESWKLEKNHCTQMVKSSWCLLEFLRVLLTKTRPAWEWDVSPHSTM